MEDEEIMQRLVRIETIIGDDSRGLLREIGQLRDAVEDLKAFQMKALGVFGAAMVFLQIVVPALVKQL